MSITAPPPVSSPGPTPHSGAEPATAAEVRAVAEQTRALWASLGTVCPERFNDDDLLSVMGSIEDVGRLVDASRVSTAATVEERSNRWLGKESLAAKRATTSGTDLITRITRVSAREAKRRSTLGLRMRQTQQVGTIIPAQFPVVGAAVADGTLGLDAAEIIMTGLAEISPRVEPDALDGAERSLVAAATGAITPETEGEPNAGFAFPADLLRGQVMQWQAALDPDGIAPNETEVEATSTFSFGRFRNGVYPVRGAVTPDLYGTMNLLFDTFLAAHKTPGFPSAAEQARLDAREQARDSAPEREAADREHDHNPDELAGAQPGGDRADGHDVADEQDSAGAHAHDHDPTRAEAPLPGSAGHEFDDVDTRTTGEKRADILRGMFTQLAQADGTPSIAGAPPVVLVHVNVNDLENGRGVGWIDGVEAPISLRSVHQLACNGGTQTVVFGKNGEVLNMTEQNRLFSKVQRKAILARDGGCAVPGCDAPAQWLEFHHVCPWECGGKTLVSNGVALCWRHHHTIETSGWTIRMIDGRPQVKAPAWIDPTGTWRDTRRHRADTHRND